MSAASSIKKLYLTSFNVVSALLWASLLFEGAHHLFRQAPPIQFWRAIETKLFVAQHLALFEIAHSALGLVSSPLIATTIQVLSRIFMLDVFTYQAPDCHTDFSLYLMVVSWACVEVPRYSFYAFQVLGGEKAVPYVLFFLRYSLFMVLYPTGISGEMLQQVASYPHWNREKKDWVVRFSHVVLALLYLPVGPFMIWNMWMMRKRAMKKRAEVLRGPAPLRGLIWPVTNTKTNDRSTTDTAKRIFAAAARGAKSASGERVAKAVEKERNWRFGYTKHIASHVALCCEDNQTCETVAKAGLEAAYSLFKFSADGNEELTFAESLKKPASKKFATGSLRGKLAGEKFTHSLVVPYKNKKLAGEELAQQCDEWTKRGTIESSAGDSIKICSSKAAAWMDLSDVVFIMLGATSAMGPLDYLLAHGATVVAIDLKRPQIWKGLFERVSASRGSIIYPLDAEGLSSEKDQLEHAGCDMLQDTLAICDWLDSIVDKYSTKRIVCGNYTYLDGALHVQLALAGDAIMQRLCRKNTSVALAFLCTPTDDHVITTEARKAAEQAYKKASGWQKLLAAMGVLVRNTALKPVNDMYVVDGIVSRQGPNYALAKRLQHWRAIVARSEGHTVSSNVAPSTATQSVISNPQFAAGYYGWRYFRPLEVFMQETSGAVMFALLVNDLRNPLSTANPTVRLPHPLNLFTEQSFHGGIWRCAFSIDSVGVPAALTYYVQKYGGVAVGAVAVVVGAVNYVIKGKVV
jgi:hypothetical protein